MAIDFETATGNRDSICQIGIAEVIDGVIQNTRSWMVQPPFNLYWPMCIEIHGITPEMTEAQPLFPDVWKEVRPILEGKTIIAHNTAFDMYCLRDALELYDLEFPNFEYICTFKAAKKVYPQFESYKLNELSQKLDLDLNNHHHAESDAIACARLMLKCLDVAGCSIADFPAYCGFHVGKFAHGTFAPCTKYPISDKKLFESLGSDPSKHDPGNYFYGKTVCLTGKFEYGDRKSMAQRIADIGGVPVPSVTKTTNILVVGRQDRRVVGDDMMSKKQEKARDLKNAGHSIEIMCEDEFFERL